jgi:hypothetical protein
VIRTLRLASTCLLLAGGCLEQGATGRFDPAAATVDLPVSEDSLPSVFREAGPTAVLAPDGLSRLGWLFEPGSGPCSLAGNGVGEGDHVGAHYYADDWSCGPGNSDIGVWTLSPVEGEVVFAGGGGTGGTGNQVFVLTSDDMVWNGTHFDHVEVQVGDQVGIGTRVGQMGCTGLSCVSPYTAHLHAALFRDVSAESEGETGLYWIERGMPPSERWYSSSGITFAAPFVHDEWRQPSFTTPDAARRISPILREVALADSLASGSTYTASWTVMGYHGPMSSAMTIRCGEVPQTVVSAVDDTPSGFEQGWHWGHAFSRNYSYSVSFRMPAYPDRLGAQTCRVRFFWSSLGYAHESVSDADAAYLSVLIPGGVDSRAADTQGRELLRTVHWSGGGPVDGTLELTSTADHPATQSDAASRISPVVVEVDLPGELRSGRGNSVQWFVEGYHNIATGSVSFECGNRVASATTQAVYEGNGEYSWGTAQTRRYRFDANVVGPSGYSGECFVRFFSGGVGSEERDAAQLSVLIPANVDPNPHSNEGRRLVRQMR